MIRLKELRERKKLTQKALAEIVGVQYATYNLWELGKNEMSYEYIKKFAKFYNVSTDYLLGIEPEIGVTYPQNYLHITDDTTKEIFQELSSVPDNDKKLVLGFIYGINEKNKKWK